MAIFKRHESCERCGSSDAKAIYSDGGSYCFSCGCSSGTTADLFIPTNAFKEEEDGFFDEEAAPLLPTDLSHEFPQEVYEWLQPTGLEYAELIRNGYFFSRAERGLVRVLYQWGGTELCKSLYRSLHPRRSSYELRRVFGNSSYNQGAASKGPKTLFRGSKEQAHGGVQPVESSRPEAVCLVEDSLSAIKCGRMVDAIPLFGSTISNDKLVRLIQPYEFVYCWLDSDKLGASRSILERAKLIGKQGGIVYSDLDPKYCNPAEWLL